MGLFLQKRPIILKSQIIVATPYTFNAVCSGLRIRFAASSRRTSETFMTFICDAAETQKTDCGWDSLSLNPCVLSRNLCDSKDQICTWIQGWNIWWEMGGWGRDPKKCTGRGWGMGSSTIQWALRLVVKYYLRRGVGLIEFLKMVLDPSPPPLLLMHNPFRKSAQPTRYPVTEALHSLKT